MCGANRVEQVGKRGLLRYVRDRAGRERLGDMVLVGEHRQRDQLERGTLAVCFAHEHVTGQIGQPPIHEEEVDVLAFGDEPPGPGIPSLGHDANVVVSRQEGLHTLTEKPMVVDDADSRGHAPLP